MLTQAQLDEYSAEGILVIRGFFSELEVQQASQCADRLQKAAEDISSQQTGKVMNKGTQFVVDRSDNKAQIHRIVWAGAAEPELLTLARQPKLLEPVSQILGSDEADQLINQLHYKLPGDGVKFDWHQDVKNRRTFDPNWKDINAKGSFVQTIIAVDPSTAENGTIFYVPKSHLHGDLFLEKISDPEELNRVAELDKALPLTLNPGDLVLMHPYLIHGSKANESLKPRRIFINGFSYPGANTQPYPGEGSSQRINLKPAITASSLSSGMLYAYNKPANATINLCQILDHYGFKSPTQKQALHYLMQQANIEDVDALLHTNAKNSAELGGLLLKFVRGIQEKFIVRTGAQERWEVAAAGWMKIAEQQTQTLAALKALDMVHDIPPAFEDRDAICILGASNITMVSRINHVENLMAQGRLQAPWLVMLAGERYVTPDKDGQVIDGSEAELNHLAAKLGKDITTLTETDLMRAAYQASKLLYGKYAEKEVLIDTPKGALPRPSTEATVSKLCDWLREHAEVKKITFISNQPHVEYQKAIITQVLEKHKVAVEFEVIGSAYNSELLTVSDNINYLTRALGTKIWAKTPAVIDAAKLNLADDSHLREGFYALYKQSPVMRSNFEAKYSKAKLQL